MLHQIKVRRLNDDEKSKPNPKFLKTDENNFQLKLQSLVQEIRLIPDVLSVKESDSYVDSENKISGFCIDIESKLETLELLKKAEKIFIKYGNNLRYDGPPWAELE